MDFSPGSCRADIDLAASARTAAMARRIHSVAAKVATHKDVSAAIVA